MIEKNINYLFLFSSFSKIEEKFKVLKRELSPLEKVKDVQIDYSFYGCSKNSHPGISLGLSTDVSPIVNNDLHALGISFSIIFFENQWKFDGEIGWSSYDYGFDELFALTIQEIDIILLLEKVSIAINDLITFLKKEFYSYEKKLS